MTCPGVDGFPLKGWGLIMLSRQNLGLMMNFLSPEETLKSSPVALFNSTCLLKNAGVIPKQSQKVRWRMICEGFRMPSLKKENQVDHVVVLVGGR